MELFEEVTDRVKLPERTDEEWGEIIAEWEDIREEAHEKSNDNSQRRRYELAWYYRYYVVPDLTEKCLYSIKTRANFMAN